MYGISGDFVQFTDFDFGWILLSHRFDALDHHIL